MPLILLSLFVGLPILEIWLLIQVGGSIGTWEVIGLCIATGVVGAWLSRTQGAQLLREIQIRISRGEVPANTLVDALMVVVAGVLLMTPGFVTDVVGLLLLTPGVRQGIRSYGLRVLKARMDQPGPHGSSRVYMWRSGDPRSGGRQPPHRPEERHPDRQQQPDVELLPPDVAPRAPKPKPPPIIDVD